MRRIAKIGFRLSVCTLATLLSTSAYADGHEAAATQPDPPAAVGAIPLIEKAFDAPFGVWFIELAAPMFVKQSDPSIACVLHSPARWRGVLSG